MRQAVNRGAVHGTGSSIGRPVRVKCAAHAHVAHDRKASAQGAPANFEVGFPQIRRVSIGEEVLDEGLRCIANARFLPDFFLLFFFCPPEMSFLRKRNEKVNEQKFPALMQR